MCVVLFNATLHFWYERCYTNTFYNYYYSSQCCRCVSSENSASIWKHSSSLIHMWARTRMHTRTHTHTHTHTHTRTHTHTCVFRECRRTKREFEWFHLLKPTHELPGLLKIPESWSGTFLWGPRGGIPPSCGDDGGLRSEAGAGV